MGITQWLWSFTLYSELIQASNGYGGGAGNGFGSTAYAGSGWALGWGWWWIWLIVAIVVIAIAASLGTEHGGRGDPNRPVRKRAADGTVSPGRYSGVSGGTLLFVMLVAIAVAGLTWWSESTGPSYVSGASANGSVNNGAGAGGSANGNTNNGAGENDGGNANNMVKPGAPGSIRTYSI